MHSVTEFQRTWSKNRSASRNRAIIYSCKLQDVFSISDRTNREAEGIKALKLLYQPTSPN